MESAHIAKMIGKFTKIHILCQKAGVPGWWTDHETKADYVYVMRDIFSSKSIVYSDPLVSIYDNQKSIKEKFEKELKRFKEVPLSGKQPGAIVKVKYTGKVDGRGNYNPAFQDDLIMSLGINVSVNKLMLKKVIKKIPNHFYSTYFC